MNNPFDLTKYTGNYITKFIFQLCFFSIILLTLYTMNADGWNFKPQKMYTCPENQYNHSCTVYEGCEGYEVDPVWRNTSGCVPTRTLFIAPGETIGDNRTEADKNFGSTVAVLLLAAVVANHALWLYKRNKL